MHNYIQLIRLARVASQTRHNQNAYIWESAGGHLFLGKSKFIISSLTI